VIVAARIKPGDTLMQLAATSRAVITIEATQKHQGTGRSAAVVRVEDFASPVSVDVGNCVLVIASEKSATAFSIKTAREQSFRGIRRLAMLPTC
jgi:hypothetical protein